jgi:hypothetical protein
MTGRPSDFTPAIADAICGRLAEGESLRAICAETAMPAQSTVFRWLGRMRPFRGQYARAREAQADAYADAVVQIADEATNAAIARLQVDARKWAASRLAPKKYGDKVVQEHTGVDGAPLPELQVTFVRPARAEFPEKLAALFEPARYKVLYGGRGGAKSWGIARALLIKGAQAPLRVLCAREIQRTIRDSVHKLLKDQIEALGLGGYYEVQADRIAGRAGTSAEGTLFTFAGLKHNIDNIKSTEGVDVCWVEEAATVSKASWDKLSPTIRKAGSEIWISFNPELEDDETYQRFIVSPPSDCIVIPISWRDNPWFPDVLKREAADLLERDPDSYAHVYGGATRQTVEGAIYARELQAAATDSPPRLTRVPYDAASR